MPRYNSGNSESLDNPANALLLRADLDIALDKPSFVFVFKPADVESQQFVFHLLEPSQEFEFLYHNRTMQNLEMSVELLFARLAWTIFPLVAGFLMGKIPRRQRLSTMITRANGAGMAPSFASAEQCEYLVTRTSKSRNASSQKDGRPEDSVRGASTDSSQDEHQRSRKRHRRSNSVHDLATMEETSTDAPSSNVPSPTTRVSFHDAVCLRQEWLHQERQRPDPSHQWEEEMAWASRVYKGDVTLCETNAERWLEFNGGELKDHGLMETSGNDSAE